MSGTQDSRELRVAIVHDWISSYTGAERVLESIVRLYPNAEVFALLDTLKPPRRPANFLQGKTVRTSFLQRIPGIGRLYRKLLVLMPLAIEQFDLSSFDLVISSSSCVAKGVITGPDQLHVCYCHSPVRYAWDLQHKYLAESGIGFGPSGLIARLILHYIRNWDVRSSFGVDKFVANSSFVAERIEKTYRRTASVVAPPVNIQDYCLHDGERDDYYIVVGRMVPYKMTDLVVRAFNTRPDKQLIVVGDGPDFSKIKSRVNGPNIKLLGYQSKESLIRLTQRAKALVFAAEEDFGIVPVEALSCGTPVIAYNKGGVRDSVVPGQHGIFFNDQTIDSLVDAIDRFESAREGDFLPNQLRLRSQQFSTENFERKFRAEVNECARLKWPERFSERDHGATLSPRLAEV